MLSDKIQPLRREREVDAKERKGMKNRFLAPHRNDIAGVKKREGEKLLAEPAIFLPLYPTLGCHSNKNEKSIVFAPS